jgi:hypothetical protein
MIVADHHDDDIAPEVDEEADLPVQLLGQGGQVVGQFGGNELPGGEMAAVDVLQAL